MISFRHRFIFIHIPKTAGNSIQTVLGPYSDDRLHPRRSVGHVKDEDGTQGLDVFNDVLGFDTSLHKHATIAEYDSILGKELEGYFIFTAVRNPFDRAISKTAFEKGPISGKLDLTEFIFPTPQLHYLTIGGRLAVKTFIRFENIQEEFDLVCAKLGIVTSTLPHKNASYRRPYRDYYTDSTRAAVSKLYEDDIKHFGYVF
jgi:hypothetical protein